MLKFSKDQVHDPVMKDPAKLLDDVVRHLIDELPAVVDAYPKGYFLSIVKASIDIALRHNMDDVFTVRLFVRLRWEIAPGFYKQPKIAAVLADTSISAQQRFEHLTTPSFDDAWEEALGYTGSSEWRGEAWGSDA
ncbi:MAG: hypothetical protein AAF662_01115 [Pseudomonadota bacterium]